MGIRSSSNIKVVRRRGKFVSVPVSRADAVDPERALQLERLDNLRAVDLENAATLGRHIKTYDCRDWDWDVFKWWVKVPSDVQRTNILLALETLSQSKAPLKIGREKAGISGIRDYQLESAGKSKPGILNIVYVDGSSRSVEGTIKLKKTSSHGVPCLPEFSGVGEAFVFGFLQLQLEAGLFD